MKTPLLLLIVLVLVCSGCQSAKIAEYERENAAQNARIEQLENDRQTLQAQLLMLKNRLEHEQVKSQIQQQEIRRIPSMYLASPADIPTYPTVAAS